MPYLNPDPFRCWIGPKNWGQAIIDGELTTCLLDNGAQLNFVTPDYARKQGLAVHWMTRLSKETGEAIPPIQGIGGVLVDPSGFVIINVQVPCVKGYNEDQIAIVLDAHHELVLILAIGREIFVKLLRYSPLQGQSKKTHIKSLYSRI